MPSDDHASGSPGRAAYFRARVSQLAGDVADARARYLTLVDGQALSFYMLLAYQRLHAIDADAARVAIDRAVAREGAGPFLTTAHPELASPSFDWFQRLLEVGEIEAARHEASAGGLVADGLTPRSSGRWPGRTTALARMTSATPSPVDDSRTFARTGRRVGGGWRGKSLSRGRGMRW